MKIGKSQTLVHKSLHAAVMRSSDEWGLYFFIFKGGFTKMLGLGGFVTPLGTNTKPGISNEACTQFGFWRRFSNAVIVCMVNIQSDLELRKQLFFLQIFFRKFFKNWKNFEKNFEKKNFFLAQNNFWEILKFSTFFFFLEKFYPNCF